MKQLFIICTTLLLALPATLYAADARSQKPNIIVILADDLGFSDLGCYYTTTAFADHTIRCLKEHAEKYASQPFFSYLAFTVPHFPLQAPPEDIARYRDTYLKGWDKVREERWQNLCQKGIVTCGLAPLEPAFTPRYFKPSVLTKLGPGEIEHAVPWEQLTDEQKQYQATKMAIHAAMIDRMDREIGRVLAQVRDMATRWQQLQESFIRDAGPVLPIAKKSD